MPQALHNERDGCMPVFLGEIDGSTNSGIESCVLAQRYLDHTFDQVGFHQTTNPVLIPASVKTDMGPGGLGEVLDGRAHPAITLHQQQVTGLQVVEQLFLAQHGKTFVASPGT